MFDVTADGDRSCLEVPRDRMVSVLLGITNVVHGFGADSELWRWSRPWLSVFKNTPNLNAPSQHLGMPLKIENSTLRLLRRHLSQ